MQTRPSILVLAWQFTSSRLRRLKNGAATGLVFLLLAVLCSDLENIQQHLEHAIPLGNGTFLRHWLGKTVFHNLIVAAVTLLVLRISAPNGRGMTRQPMRFFGSLAVGTALGILASWQTGVYLGRFPSLFAADMDWVLLYQGWMNALLWGGLFGWMYFLYLRRAEDQARFGMLLGRRALLARQLAQSQIIAARAQVDPAMVVRILREVRIRHGNDAQAASRLMDHMIDYLRLALNRAREAQPTLAKELSLLRAYMDLRAAETGRQLTLHSRQPSAPQPTGSVFLVAGDMVDSAIQATQTDIEMHIATAARHTAVALHTGSAYFTPVQSAQLAARLNARIARGAEVLHHHFDANQHTYSIHVPNV